MKELHTLLESRISDSVVNKPIEISRRMRRNRQSPAIRALVQETRLHPSNFIAPYFVREGTKIKEPIDSMPGIFRLSVDYLIQEMEVLAKLGVPAVNLFFYTPDEKKDPFGTEARKHNSFLQKAISAAKKAVPEMCIMIDIALDPHTDHGHDGVIDANGWVVNDESVHALTEMSLRAAAAGCDFVSPSDMMDGRIGHIRKMLDKEGFQNVGILAYAAKYTSSFYGPFRQALDSAPKSGDKKSYQLNPANAREALLECSLDELEGADLLLIKPALTSLDIIAKASSITSLPIGAYQVSGEYSVIKAAAKEGLINSDHAIMETLICIKRAGAQFIITYAAKEAAELLHKGFPYI